MSTKSTKPKASSGIGTVLILVLLLCLVIRWPGQSADFLNEAGARVQTFVTGLAKG